MYVCMNVNIPFYSYRWNSENEAGVDLVLIQTSLLYYVNHVVLMLISIFKLNFHKKRKEFVSKQAQPQPHIHSVARTLSPQL